MLQIVFSGIAVLGAVIGSSTHAVKLDPYIQDLLAGSMRTGDPAGRLHIHEIAVGIILENFNISIDYDRFFLDILRLGIRFIGRCRSCSRSHGLRRWLRAVRTGRRRLRGCSRTGSL